jgi:hypothetical protein
MRMLALLSYDRRSTTSRNKSNLEDMPHLDDTSRCLPSLSYVTPTHTFRRPATLRAGVKEGAWSQTLEGTE